MFKAGKTGPIAAFRQAEADALRRLISDYVSLLESGPSSPDPVLARLYPVASLDNEAVASAFRDLTEDDLTAAKRSNAETALKSLGESGGFRGPLSPEQTDAWLALLTDLRLAIGVREGVTEEMMERTLDTGDPSQAGLMILHYLGSLQEDLIQAKGDPF